MRELKQQAAALTEEIRSFVDENELEKAKEKQVELRSINDKMEILVELGPEEERSLETGDDPKEVTPKPGEGEDKLEYRSVYPKLITGQRLSKEERSIAGQNRGMMETRGLTEANMASAGYVVPKDDQTKIIKLQRDMQDILQYVNVEEVSTLSGTRVIEVDAEYTPLTPTGEGQPIPDTDDPEFAQLDYKLKKLTGKTSLTNELVADSDQNIKKYTNEWLAKKDTATNNVEVFSGTGGTDHAEGLLVASGITVVEVTDTATLHSVIKKTLNVRLDTAISKTSKIFTNQSGFDLVDQLEDGNKKPLLQEDASKEIPYKVKGKQIVAFSDRVLKNTNDGTDDWAYFIIGDLKRAYTAFVPKSARYAIRATDIGAGAFENDTTVLRMIKRFDGKPVDKKAIVILKVKLPAA